MHFACSSGALQVVKFFLEEVHCDPNCSKCLFDMTLVHVAAQNGQLEVLKYLASMQADFRLPDVSGENVLHKAALKGDLPVLCYLLGTLKLTDLLLEVNHDALSPYAYFMDLCSKQGHPKQLTEVRDYEEALSSVQKYLWEQTDSVECWQRRKCFLTAFVRLRTLKFV